MKEKIIQILNDANFYGISPADFEDIADKIVVAFKENDSVPPSGFHFMFNDKSYKGGTLKENTEMISRLYSSHNANIEQREDGLYVCWNHHEKGDPCEYEKEIDYTTE